MEEICSKEDWERLFKKAYSKSEFDRDSYPYPREFPCLGKFERETDYYYPGGGGDYVIFYVAYFPKTRSPRRAFIEGLEIGWQKLFTA